MIGLFTYRVRYVNDSTLEVFESCGIAAGLSMSAVFSTVNSWYKNVESVEIEHLTDGLYEINEDTYRAVMLS
jgi:hypothetical protein